MLDENYHKMIAGEWYDPTKLADLRLKAQTLCHRYNLLEPAAVQERQKLLRELFGTITKTSVVEQPFHCDYGINIHFGERCFLNYNCVMLDCAPITFGEHVLCGPGCSFLTAIHPTDPLARLTDVEKTAPITLGNNVWLGGNVTVLPGVTIGENTIVGAGSVVTKSLPANVIAVGNPARIIKTLPSSNASPHPCAL